MSPAQLARKALTVSGWTLASRLLGLVRDRLWAGIGGGTPLLDAFLTAFQIPNLLRNLFGEGALTTAFIPRYAQLKERDPAAAEAFAGVVLARLTLVLSLIALAFMALCAGIIAWGDLHSKAVLVAALAAPMVPFLVFVCVTALLGGMLNVRRHFWVSAACPVLLNLCMISTIWMTPEREVWCAPYAVLGAGLLMTALSFAALARTGGIPPLSFTSTPEYRQLRNAMGPSLLSSGAYQINAALDTYMAMFLIGGGGPVQFLYFGNRLLQFPLALIGHGVTTVAFPEMARRAGEGWAATGEGLRVAVRLQAFWLLPAAVGLLVCAEPLVRTIYQTGAFQEEAVARTVLVTQFLALSLVPVSLVKLLVRAFYAHHDQRTPFLISLATIALNLVLNLILIFCTPLREAGLALASGIAAVCGLMIYLTLLRRRGTGGVVDWRGLIRPFLAAMGMGAAVVGLLHFWPQPQGHGSGTAAVRLLVAVVAGGVVYVAVAGTGWLRRKAKPAPVVNSESQAPMSDS
jgi:putative peptidoglycan lipid II flippase